MNKQIIEISTSKTINNIDLNNIYCLWYDKNELEQNLITITNTNINMNTDIETDNDVIMRSYMSSFFSSKADKLNELVNNGYIMIFIKNPKLLYGFIKVNKILIKNIPSNSYLEDIDEKYTNELLNNDLILIDENKFNKVVKQYKFIEVPKMFLIEFDYLYQFKYEIGIKKINTFILNDSIDKNKIPNEFKYSNKVQNKEMYRLRNDDFINNLFNYIDYLNETNELNVNRIIEPIKLDKKNKFCIPILWNGCKCIKDMFIHQTTKLDKKMILSHYLNCIKCEINNNNDTMTKLDNKKIVINMNVDVKIFDSIINSYKNLKSFYSNSDILQIDKINIITCIKSSSIYNECIFIVEQ